MALFTRLKSFCIVHKCLKFNLISKNVFHALSGPPGCPQSGTRSFSLKFWKKPTQSDFKIADDVPDEFQLIYRNAMSRYILGAQIVSMVTGCAVIIGLLLRTEYRPYRRESLEWNTQARPTENEEFYYIFFFVLFLTLVQLMISRTTIRLYKISGTTKYVGINYGRHLFGKEKFSFHRKEIVQMEESGIFPWRNFRYLIETKTDRKSVILVDQYFRRPADLSIMLGEQKDPDLEETE